MRASFRGLSLGRCGGRNSAMPILSLENVSLGFGGVRVLDDVSFFVEPGEVVGLIGPNGAGKTSAMNVITGVHRPRTGAIKLDQSRIDGLSPHRIAALGVRRTFQTSMLCPGLTVLENVMLGVEPEVGYGVVAALGATRSMISHEAAARDRAMEMLSWVGMADFAQREGQGLSFGQQRLVEMARALVGRPRLLLLDEPAVGLSPPRVDELAQNIRKIAKTFGTAIILIEHVIQLVLSSCERVVVMNAGQVIAQGQPQTVTSDPAVIASYLGRGYYAAS
jgi:branched-chain amino acid transport system ATP-binding protein